MNYIRKKWYKIVNPQNVIEAISILLGVQTILGLFPYNLNVTSQGKLVHQISIIGSIIMFFSGITYLTFFVFIMMEKQSENHDLTDAIFFKYYENIVTLLFSINTIVLFISLTIFKNKLFKVFNIMLSIESRMINIGNDSRKSFKHITICSICIIIIGSSLVLGLSINGIFYHSKIYEYNKELSFAYTFTKTMSWIYFQIVINMIITMTILSQYGVCTLNKILLNASIVERNEDFRFSLTQ